MEKLATCSLRRTKFKNGKSDFPQMSDLEKTEAYLLTNEYLPRIPLYPQANEPSVWTLARSPHLALLVHRYSTPQTFNRPTCFLLRQAYAKLQFLCCSQINLI